MRGAPAVSGQGRPAATPARCAGLRGGRSSSRLRCARPSGSARPANAPVRGLGFPNEFNVAFPPSPIRSRPRNSSSPDGARGARLHLFSEWRGRPWREQEARETPGGERRAAGAELGKNPPGRRAAATPDLSPLLPAPGDPTASPAARENYARNASRLGSGAAVGTIPARARAARGRPAGDPE